MSNKIPYKEGDIIGVCIFINDEEPVRYGKGGYRRTAKFRCKCGNEFVTVLNRVKQGDTKSCGCDKSLSHYKHGESALKTSEFGVWCKIRQRCLNKKDNQYVDYGGRGIGISNDWLVYANFIRDMGRRPSANHSIERINNNLGYCKENCKWATTKEQSINKRSNLYITYNGETKALSQWADFLNIRYHLLHKRLTKFPKWTVEEAFTTPIKRPNRYLHKNKAA